MRIISGQARGLKLIAPDGLDTRPTTDRVKESIFNLIIPYIPANAVLDLFAGSGALGIEALSRRSDFGVFVESDKEAFKVINKNLEHSRFLEKSETILGDAISYLRRTDKKFDIVFLDPPYNTGLLTRAVDIIFERNILTPCGIIVAESEAGGEVPPSSHFDIIKQAKYGKTTVFILKRPEKGRC